MLAPAVGWNFGDFSHSGSQGTESHRQLCSDTGHREQSGAIHILAFDQPNGWHLASPGAYDCAAAGHTSDCRRSAAPCAARQWSVVWTLQLDVQARVQPCLRTAWLLVSVGHRVDLPAVHLDWVCAHGHRHRVAGGPDPQAACCVARHQTCPCAWQAAAAGWR
jgi:hypothetical protein